MTITCGKNFTLKHWNLFLRRKCDLVIDRLASNYFLYSFLFPVNGRTKESALNCSNQAHYSGTKMDISWNWHLIFLSRIIFSRASTLRVVTQTAVWSSLDVTAPRFEKLSNAIACVEFTKVYHIKWNPSVESCWKMSEPVMANFEISNVGFPHVQTTSHAGISSDSTAVLLCRKLGYHQIPIVRIP